ncbi:YtpR family tRNA-binding protein [Pseudalkalibacillus caeni]|uniref:DUF4479 domain-containing protein n=1 Tax=Exobacillus caeni TaxID=2574798 RepID=A0A5R9FHM5_9BACL|nr:DUF4479 family protein [Pseudalkalibacillus caeni]TLS39075.1 DUF4479 domain-containing protein [Pseudalkalibacillus caeni]
MNVFYNKEGIGDTLIVSLKPVDMENRAVERKGNVARIFDKSNDNTSGYNIFGFSSIQEIDANGQVELNESLVETINSALDNSGFEGNLEFDASPKFVVGFVESKEKHPNADKLNICKVDVGSETLQIVCGAPNVEQGQKVVVAKVGAVMPGGMLIKEANLRGIDSFGMICSAKELALPDAPTEKGILILPDDYQTGNEFKGR